MCIYSRDIFTIVGFCPNRTHFTLHICMIMYGYICIYTIYIIWLYIYILQPKVSRFPELCQAPRLHDLGTQLHGTQACLKVPDPCVGQSRLRKGRCRADCAEIDAEIAEKM
jgi:hypothetical protein